MRAHQSALNQQVHRAIDGRRTNLDTFLAQSTLDATDGKMLAAFEDDARDEVALPGDRQVPLAQPAMKALEQLFG